MAIDLYIQIFIGIILLYWITDLVMFKTFKQLYSERTGELRRSIDVRIYHHLEKKNDSKPKLAPVPPNPWDNQRQPTHKEILDQAEELSKGKGIDNYFPLKGKKK
jgi:hypothetical protein